MAIIGYITAIILTRLNGFLLLKILDNGGNKLFFYKIEYGIYSFLVGVILITFLAFIGGWMEISLSFTTMIVISVATSIILGIVYIILGKKGGKRLSIHTEEIQQRSPTIKIGVGIFILRLIIKLSFGFLSIANVPTYQDDAFVNRNYRSKVFFERESLVLDKEDKDHLGGGYKQYPLSPYLYKAYLAKRTGKWNEGLVNIPSFLFYICSLALIFFFITKETKKTIWGILAVWALTNIPLYYIHGTSPYFDIFQGVYVFLALTTLYRYIENKISIVYPILLIGILGYTKSEGLIIFTIGVLATYLMRILINHSHYKESFKKFIKIALGVMIINIPLIIFKIQQGLGFGNGNTAISSIDLGFHPEIFPSLYNALFETGSYNLLFFSFLIIVGYNIITKSITKRTTWFLLGLGMCFLIIMSIYMTTYTYQYVIDQTGINRSMMQIIPIIITTMILSCHDIYEKYYK